jgi:hypothetical protein
MNKNKFFIKRKNTYSSAKFSIFSTFVNIFLVLSTLGWGWLMICLINALVND